MQNCPTEGGGPTINWREVLHQRLSMSGSSLDGGLNQESKIECLGYLLHLTTVSCLDLRLTIQMAITLENGRQVKVPLAYKSTFLKIVNKDLLEEGQFTLNVNGELCLSMYFELETETKVQEVLISSTHKIKRSIKELQNAVTILGFSSKFTKIKFQVLRNQLILYEKVAMAFNMNRIDQNLDYFQIEQKKNSTVDYSFTEIQPVEGEEQEIMTIGQTFEVRKIQAQIKNSAGQKEFKFLVMKKRIEQMKNNEKSLQKLQRQLKIVSQIINPQYTLKYYSADQNPSCFYMQYVPCVLKDFSYDRQLTVQEMLKISGQLIEGVAILHKSGIIHRDLKLENILISRKGIKIIDFAEAATINGNPQQYAMLGSTLPYSAFQCRLSPEEGYNRFEIDFWSIALIIYEIGFKSLPIFYYHIGKDVVHNWRYGNEFSIHPIFRKRRGLLRIGTILSLTAIKGLQINPQDRLSLTTFKKILVAMDQFCKAMKNIT